MTTEYLKNISNVPYHRYFDFLDSGTNKSVIGGFLAMGAQYIKQFRKIK